MWKLKNRQILGILIGGSVFMVGIPVVLFVISKTVDDLLNLEKPIPEPLNLVVAVVFLALGILLVSLSVFAQIKIGRGTPIPAIPTQRLVTTGPYSLCRNPMLLGTVLYYFGISTWLNSVSAMTLTALFLVVSTVYIKLIEEKELEKRFGESYLKYKRKTPFLIPRLDKHIRDLF
jgi:protein-S-isoprenylcysteine O-methyltransferase Ste14